MRFLIERRLKATVTQLRSLRSELTGLHEQRAQLSEEAEDEELRALVSDSPFAAREAKDASRHANAFERRHARVVAEIARLEALQDQLLDQLSAKR